MLIPKLIMKAELKNHGKITGKIIEKQRMIGFVKTGISDFKQYTGEYIVVPYKEDIILETDNRLLLDDLTVKEIPYAQVGNTISIGG